MLYNQERIIPAIKGCYNHCCYMVSLHRVARRAPIRHIDAMAYNRYILLDDDFSKSSIETCSVYPIWGYILKRATLSIMLFQ